MQEKADGIGLVIYDPPHVKWVREQEFYTKIRKVVPSLVGIKVADGMQRIYQY